MKNEIGTMDRMRMRHDARAFLILAAVTAALFALGACGLLSSNTMRYLLQIFLYIALGEAWNLLSGFAGMTSLGQQLYVGLAGYSLAVVTTLWHRPLLTGLLAGALVSVLIALLLSRLLFRLQGMYFAIAGWVAAEAAEKLFLNWGFVGRGSGMTVQLPVYPTVDKIYLLALLVCAGSVGISLLILRLKLGLGLLAMRDDPVAAATVGVNLAWSRLAVYLTAALITALAGGVFFLNKGTIYPDSGFSIGWTVSVVFICIVGGTGTVLGPVVGSAVYVLLREYLAHYPGWSNIFLGLVTVVMILFLPEGIVSAAGRLLHRAGRKAAGEREHSDDTSR